MNKKTTLLLNCLFAIAFTQLVNAQQIYSNGPLSTGTTSKSGVVAPAGYTWSETQNQTGNTTESNSLGGAGGVYSADEVNSIINVDDFVVPANQIWNVSSVEIFVYQTGYMGTTLPPVDQMRVQIFSGDPQFGGTVIAGNLTTNVIDIPNSTDAMMYRIFNSAVPAPGIAAGTTRKIWKVRGTIATTLPSGTYWLVYQLHSTNDGNSFFPPLTIPGVRGLAGWNAKQNVLASNALGQDLGWAPLIDDGLPTSAPDFPLDFPFIINGTVTLGVSENDLQSSVLLFPNPAKNRLNITVPTDVTILSYEINDMSGRVVKSFRSTTTVAEIDVVDLAAGNYFLKLQTDKGFAIKKFIKE